METADGRGTQLASTFTRDDSGAATTDTYEVTLAGSLLPTQG